MALASGFELNFDRARLDLDRVEAMLRTSYWASHRPREAIQKAIDNSLCISAFRSADKLQVGLARLVTDYADFAWLADVIVDETFRGLGIGTAMVEGLLSATELGDVRILLRTRDAHSLYEQFGFAGLPSPGEWMMRPPAGPRPF